MKKILIIAAHPDDDLLGCGGLMAKYRNKKQFSVLFISEGSSCRFLESDLNTIPVQDNIQERAKHAVAALKMLDISRVKFLDFPCGRLDTIPILDINHLIEKEIKSFNPDAVITHSEDDVNNDHKIVNRSVIMATRPSLNRTIKTIMCFEVQSSSEWNLINPFQPNFFEVLEEEDLEMKWEAISHYESEIRQYPHPRSKEGTYCHARYRGMQCGFYYAEAFRVIRGISI